MVIKVGEVYETNNFGTLEVIEYVNASKVRIKFLDTGSTRYTAAKEVRNGKVKDLYMPNVCGVGYMGEGAYKSKIKTKSTKVYDTWSDMLKRCYSVTSLEKRPTYKGCSVAEEWHNFQVFGAWFDTHYIAGYHLDKDIKVPGNKVYGPDTCTFVTPAENTEAAWAVTSVFRSPEGERVEVYNITKFARENGLDQGGLSGVSTGRRRVHLGWTKWGENTVATPAVVFVSPEGEKIEVDNVAKFAREKELNPSAMSAVKNGKRNHHKGWTLYKD